MAKKLEYALGVDASFWIDLQANYEKELADFEEINQISSEELEIMQKIKNITSYAQEMRLIDSDAIGSMFVIEWRKRLNSRHFYKQEGDGYQIKKSQSCFFRHTGRGVIRHKFSRGYEQFQIFIGFVFGAACLCLLGFEKNCTRNRVGD